MKKIFIVFGHHNISGSFNSQIRDTFVNEAEKLGHTIDLVNLFDEEEQVDNDNSTETALNTSDNTLERRSTFMGEDIDDEGEERIEEERDGY